MEKPKPLKTVIPKKIRKEIYKKMLDTAKITGFYGFCNLLSIVFPEEYKYLVPEDCIAINGDINFPLAIGLFPELMKYKPNGIHYTQYWFPCAMYGDPVSIEARQLRISILTEINNKLNEDKKTIG